MVMASKQVHVRLPEQRREKWNEHAETHYGGNLSRLIRSGVEAQIRADKGESQTAGDTSGGLDTVLSAVEDIETRLGDMTAEMGRLGDAVNQTLTVSDRIASDVFGALPSNDYKPATPEAIAEEINADVKDVEIALVQLRHETKSIGFRPGSESGFVYWRED